MQTQLTDIGYHGNVMLQPGSKQGWVFYRILSNIVFYSTFFGYCIPQIYFTDKIFEYLRNIVFYIYFHFPHGIPLNIQR